MITLKTQRGFSLVEAMVAMVISLVLIAGIVQIYLSNKETYRFGEAVSRVQESGRFGLDFLATEIRMADFWGCTAFGGMSSDLNPAGAGYIDFLNAGDGGLVGTEGGADPDSITIAGAFDRGITVQEPYMPTVSASLFISQDSGLQDDDIIMVSDCEQGDIFQVTNIQAGTGGNSGKNSLVHNTGTSLNLTGDLSKTYEGDASVYQMMQRTFFIADNPVGEPALFMSENGAAAEELVDGVEDMQITYGEDTDGDGVPNRFVDADNVGDMASVLAVRISLVVRSPEDGVMDDPQVYVVNGASVTAGDRRLRQVFTSTISIRNRLN